MLEEEKVLSLMSVVVTDTFQKKVLTREMNPAHVYPLANTSLCLCLANSIVFMKLSVDNCRCFFLLSVISRGQ